MIRVLALRAIIKLLRFIHNMKTTILKSSTCLLAASVMVLCIALPLFFNTSCTAREQEEKDSIQRRREFEMRMEMEAAAFRKDFATMRRLSDTLHAWCPHDPTIYFVDGWMYDMLGDSVRARACFMRNKEMYDSLIEETDFGPLLDGHYFNRLGVIQILYGQEACTKEVERLIPIYIKLNLDTLGIASFRDLIRYDKHKLFNGRAYKDEKGNWFFEHYED